MMRVTYYCLKRIQVGDDWREVGDLIPEAAEWCALRSHIQDADIAPVLVETLPKAAQASLQRYFDDVASELEGAPV